MSHTENICVHVRVRPLNDAEKDRGKAWKVEGNSIVAVDGGFEPYMLDNMFDGNCSTAEVYERTAQPLINQVIGGFNSTVFAYGQTSSGKTHTMRGTAEDPGLVPRAVNEIFDLISSTPDREFLLRVSYMELYNEDINDLLAPENQKLQVHESKDTGIYVAGLREEIVSSPEQVLQLLEEGERFRHIGETKMNKASSRSHTIFRMVVESRCKEVNTEEGDFGAIRVSTLTLVDLAGSERIAKTGAEGQRMKEGAAINKSLLTLGTVINKLSEGTQLNGGHIPYRDSKLTRILQPSLGGNAKTAIICNITPAAQHVEESHSTLRFATRAKKVVNNATVNEVVSDAAVLKRQAKEIEDLRKILQSTGNAHIDEEISRLRTELLRKDQENDHMQMALAAEKEERERAQRKVDNMTRLMLDSNRGSPQQGVKAGKPKKDNRRETWCPGAGARKRPLLAANQLASLLENGKEGASLAAQRKSDGAALGLSLPSSGVSPPLKMPRGVDMAIAEDDEEDGQEGRTSVGVGRASEVSGSMSELQSRVRELETANNLMQRELEAVSENAVVTQKQLRDAEDELVAVADERDALSLKLKEAEWKARQAEREVGELKAERDAAVEVATAAEAALEQAQSNGASAGGEVHQQVEAIQKERDELKQQCTEYSTAKEDLERQVVELTEENTRLEGKAQSRKAALQDAEERLSAKSAELEALRSEMASAEGRCADAEGRSRELYEEVTRLTSHISDLESRKRAPLYQKKQEEELRAATEKAAEAEVRAVEAEMRLKEAKAAEEAAEKEAEVLKTELEKVKAEAAEDAADFESQKQSWSTRAAADAQKLTEKHEQALNAVKVEQEALAVAKSALEESLAAAQDEVTTLKQQAMTVEESIAALQAQLDETQQCADAAAEHVRFLEEKAEQENAAHETAVAELSAKIDDLNVQAANAARAAEEAMAAAIADHAASMEQAKCEKEALEAVNAALEVTKTELEARVAQAAGALNASDELKELRRKYKEETTRLNLALKSASHGSKGTERAADKAQKEMEKLRNQVKDLEGKLRAALADKNKAQLEKAGVERELRMAKTKEEKLSKNLDKIHGAEERKRETMMAGLNQTKSRLQQTEESLNRVQVDLEKAQFELTAKSGECTRLEGEMAELQKSFEDVTGEKDQALDELAATKHELAALTEEADGLRTQLATTEESLTAANEKTASLEEQIAALEDERALLTHTKSEIEASLEATQTELTEITAKLEAAEARLPEIEELSSQVSALKEDLEEARNVSEETRTELTAKIEILQEEGIKLEARIQDMVERHTELTQEKATLGIERDEISAKLTELSSQHDELTQQHTALTEAQQAAVEEIESLKEKSSVLETTVTEKLTYISSLENQINDAMAENMEVQAAAHGANERCAELEQAVAQLQADLEQSRGQLAALTEQLQQAEGAGADSSAQVAELTAQLQAAKTASAEAEDRCNALETQLAALRDSHAQTDGQRAEFESAATAASEQVSKLEATVQQLTTELNAVKAEREEAALALESTRSELAAIQASLSANEQQALAATGSAEEWKTKAEAAIAAEQHASTKLLETEQELSSLKSTVADTEERLAQLEAQCASGESKRAAMAAELRSKENSVAETHAAAQNALRAAHELQAELQEERQKGSALEAELETVKLQMRSEQQRLAQQQQPQLIDEASERKIATLNSQIQQLESQLHHVQSENQQLARKATEAAAGHHGSVDAAAAHAALEQRCLALEADLRKSRRREEKLQALQYRLKEDVQSSGGNVAAFETLKNVRELEYEMDRVANRAAREKAVLKEQLDAARQKIAQLESGAQSKASLVQSAAARSFAVEDKENVY